MKKSDHFIDQYIVSDGIKINFPVDDPNVLYELEAWTFPESYRQSDLKDIRAVMNRKGEIEIIQR